MPALQRSVVVGYSQQRMYDLVNDVGTYSEFLPWCESSTVLRSAEREMVARICLRKGPVASSFTTRNVLTPPDEIRLQLLDGPFSRLDGCWTFKALGGNACKIEVQLRFAFRSKPQALVLKGLFPLLVDAMVDGFRERARQLYGEPGHD